MTGAVTDAVGGIGGEPGRGVDAAAGGGFRYVDEREIHRGHVWRLVNATFEDPHGDRFDRDIVRSPGAVGVVPLLFDPEGTPAVVMLRQWRPAHQRELWEIPAGMRDVPDESPLETARRELAEEAGYRAADYAPLIEMLPSPGLTDSVTSVFLATGLDVVERDVQGPEEEHMRVELVPLDVAVAMVERGEIQDAKTAVGVLLAARRVSRGDHDG